MHDLQWPGVQAFDLLLRAMPESLATLVGCDNSSMLSCCWVLHCRVLCPARCVLGMRM